MSAVIHALATASLLVASAASADPAAPPATSEPDPAAEDAANANLEPVGRHGVIFSGALMPGMFVGFGSRSDSGVGGSFSLRLGKVASSTTVMYFELHGAGLIHDPNTSPPTTVSNSFLASAVGAQHYIAPSLWLRLSLGWGGYGRNDEMVDGVLIAHETLAGPYGNVGIGLDLVRWRRATLGLEAISSMLIHTKGISTVSGTGLSLTF